MKALLCREQHLETLAQLERFVGPGQGHRLDRLFELLSCTLQQRIERYMVALQPPVTDFVLRGRTVSDLVHGIFEIAEHGSVRELLAKHGRSFERWRYSYESERLTGASTFLLVLMDATLRCAGHYPKPSRSVDTGIASEDADAIP
jgi:hypothetical protein